MIDMCCLQELRWRGQGSRMLGMEEKRYKLWWSGKGDGVGGVIVMMKEELCERVVEVKRVSDRMIAVVLVFEKDVLRLIYMYAQHSGRIFEEKLSSYESV